MRAELDDELRLALEEDQLVEVRRQHRYGPARLSRVSRFVLWSLRFYVAFMLAVIVFEFVHGS